MMRPEQVKRYYENTSPPSLQPWSLERKHIRIVTRDKRFIKLNTIGNRVNEKALWKLCTKYSPTHVYMSVLNYLFPESVGLKRSAKYAYPVGGEYVFDVDNYLFRGVETHEHPRTWICIACLEVARKYTIRLTELVEENYENIAIVFSGARGFHIHVLDFNVRDWTHYNEHDPVKSHEVARFRYTLHLARQLDARFDEPHFTLSVDPVRIISVPQTLNASTGLVCRLIGSRVDLERKSASRILDEASSSLAIWGGFSQLPLSVKR
ncbi:MAG: hypothetical protein FGF53_05290 [Candidatus Brockarchaeota archaeon]|nr:hypothetical protein [Candidatus Brockarchaeota archaeon]MBO3808775.1 hypothetical protein [Candidatus Brockarchaeota archaeon]